MVPSSGNSGENDPWRYTTEPFVNESIELLAGVQPHWFTPRLRFFAGREDKLPVDQNSLLALVAPRGLMMYSGYAESAGNPLGFEQAYRSALRVYRFLGREQNIWLSLREGEHETTAGDVENFIDFFDAVFERRRARRRSRRGSTGTPSTNGGSCRARASPPSSYPVDQLQPGRRRDGEAEARASGRSARSHPARAG